MKGEQSMKRMLLSLLLTGCAMSPPAADWPKLDVFEHYVPHAEMRDRCARWTAWGASPEACAEWNFVRRRCDIWYSADFPPQRFIIEHERKHCAGWMH